MSFYHALEGIAAALREERHMRIHTGFTAMIMIFAYFYGISAVAWAVLFMICASVISAELLNTAIERTVDTATHEFSDTAKLAKDAAAGAVLVLAFASVLIGFSLFGDFDKIKITLNGILASPLRLVICSAVFAASVLFVIFGGKNDK